MDETHGRLLCDRSSRRKAKPYLGDACCTSSGKRGVNVTVYGLNPWNSLLTFGVDAGPVPNNTDLQSFCEIITERLRRLYDVGGPHVEG
jgi:hypothetical protein